MPLLKQFPNCSINMQIAFRLMQTRAFLTTDDVVPVLQGRFCDPEDRHLTFFCRNVIFALVDDNLENIDPVQMAIFTFSSIKINELTALKILINI